MSEEDGRQGPLKWPRPLVTIVWWRFYLSTDTRQMLRLTTPGTSMNYPYLRNLLPTRECCAGRHKVLHTLTPLVSPPSTKSGSEDCERPMTNWLYMYAICKPSTTIHSLALLACMVPLLRPFLVLCSLFDYWLIVQLSNCKLSCFKCH